MNTLMCESVDVSALMNKNWSTLEINGTLNLRTPDNKSGAIFTITSVDSTSIELEVGKSRSKIKKNAFIETLKYLIQNKHTHQNKCIIGSNKETLKASDLCNTARTANNSQTMVINYILPILGYMNLVQIDGNRPNKTWYIETDFH